MLVLFDNFYSTFLTSPSFITVWGRGGLLPYPNGAYKFVTQKARNLRQEPQLMVFTCFSQNARRKLLQSHKTGPTVKRRHRGDWIVTSARPFRFVFRSEVPLFGCSAVAPAPWKTVRSPAEDKTCSEWLVLARLCPV